MDVVADREQRLGRGRRGSRPSLGHIFRLWYDSSALTGNGGSHSHARVERPIHSAFFALACAGGCVILAARILSRRLSSKNAPAGIAENGTRDPRALRLSFLLLVVALTLRVDLTRRTIAHASCATDGYTLYVPLTASLLTLWLSRLKRRSRYPDSTASSSQAQSLVRLVWTDRRYRDALAIVLLTLSAWALAPAALRSTYICPVAGNQRSWTAIGQSLTFVLDICIVAYANHIYTTATQTSYQPVVVMGWVLVVSTCILSPSWSLLTTG